MFDFANWVACLNGENGPGGTPSHEALSVSPQGALEISSVTGQPPSLDRNHFSTPRVVAESYKRDERCRPSSQRPQYPNLYRHLKQRLGRSLRASLYKGSVVRQGKKATHKCSRAEGGFSGPSKVQGPVFKPDLSQVVHSSCRSICHSSEPQSSTVRISSPRQNAWDIDALNINWSGLTAYAYPTTALLHRVIQKIGQSSCLIIVIAPGWPGMPWF